MYALARRILVTAAAAEDVLQEAFVEVIRGIDGFRGEARFAEAASVSGSTSRGGPCRTSQICGYGT